MTDKPDDFYDVMRHVIEGYKAIAAYVEDIPKDIRLPAMPGVDRDFYDAQAERAEAELAKLREQEPIKYLYRVTDCFGHDVLRDDPRDATIIETVPLFAAPVPAVAAGLPAIGPYRDFIPAPAAITSTSVLKEPTVSAPSVPVGDDFNGTTPHMIQCIEALVSMNDSGVLAPHGIGGHARTLLIASANRLRQQAAPSVPEEWREVMAELAADLQAACDAEHPHRDLYPSVMRKYQNDMRIVERARALLQSAEGCCSQAHNTQAQNEVHHD